MSEVKNPFTRFVPDGFRAGPDANILPGHPAERASWIWAPHRSNQETAFLRFRRDFVWEAEAPLVFHVTADQRYQLFFDGELISCGPDRCDPQHWAVASLSGAVEKGRHRLEALVWFLAETSPAERIGGRNPPNPPMAQMTLCPGFLFCGGPGIAPELLDTGVAPWEVTDLTEALRLEAARALGYHDIGPSFLFDLGRVANSSATTPRIVGPAVRYSPKHGLRYPGHVLDSTPLPEQVRAVVSTGVIRGARPLPEAESPWQDGGDTAPWNELLQHGHAVTILPQTRLEILWDFGRYECGYPHLQWSGGRGAQIEFSWAESLVEAPEGGSIGIDSPRGHRDQIEGKFWHGFGDSWIAAGAEQESAIAPWWRSGRYARLRIQTGDEALAFQRLAIRTTGYPLDPAWEWKSSDGEWDRAMPLLARGLELCAHETWVDCPFYEQMMYVGDTRLDLLCNFVGYRDDRLSRRALELFDWSRAGSLAGLVAERYPSQWRQESATYAMFYPLLVRDFLFWRGEAEFVRSLLPGVRQLLESLLALQTAEGLLGRVPGWPFVDWVPHWQEGCGPGVREGDSSIVNLHLVLSLQAAAEIEDALGDPLMATRWKGIAERLFQRVHDRYWDAERHCVLDTPGCPQISEHAQALALLTKLVPERDIPGALSWLRASRAHSQATIYFSHYVLEALGTFHEAQAFFARLAFWRHLPGQGFTSLPERPEPSRSDCHAWGAHPFFHTLATVAGIRPASPGMREVIIRPMLGDLREFTASIPHPGGDRIRLQATSQPGAWEFRISLPDGVTGNFHWKGTVRPLAHDSVLVCDP